MLGAAASSGKGERWWSTPMARDRAQRGEKWRGCVTMLTCVNGEDDVGSFVVEDSGAPVTTRRCGSLDCRAGLRSTAHSANQHTVCGGVPADRGAHTSMKSNFKINSNSVFYPRKIDLK
jgi:hypothetical protein